jgi:hypothetical protein
VQEYNIRTGKLLYTWDALKHISLGDSWASLPTNGFPWDAYHINSIQLLPHGQMLVSMRDTWATYLINIKTGRIVWTLGGKHSTFKLGPKAFFSWQHDVRAYPGTQLISMLDDHCCQETGGGTYVSPSAPSRGLVLKLNQQTKTASFVSRYGHGANFDTQYMGNLQPLPGGGEFAGWGSQPYFTEYTASGQQVLDAYLPFPDISYRAIVSRWIGKPLYPPSGAARTSGGKTTVYASWNGATGVTSWRVLSGGKAVATASKYGFETRIPVPAGYHTFTVEALTSSGKVIGTSRLFSTR